LWSRDAEAPDPIPRLLHLALNRIVILASVSAPEHWPKLQEALVALHTGVRAGAVGAQVVVGGDWGLGLNWLGLLLWLLHNLGLKHWGWGSLRNWCRGSDRSGGVGGRLNGDEAEEVGGAANVAASVGVAGSVDEGAVGHV